MFEFECREILDSCLFHGSFISLDLDIRRIAICPSVVN